MVDDAFKRDIERIAVFRASKQSVSSLNAFTFVHRLCCIIFVFYCPLPFAATLSAKALASQVYGGLATSAALAFLTRSFKKRLADDFVLRIDFDPQTETFVVTMPPSSFSSLGEPEKVSVNVANFQMLSKE